MNFGSIYFKLVDFGTQMRMLSAADKNDTDREADTYVNGSIELVTFNSINNLQVVNFRNLLLELIQGVKYIDVKNIYGQNILH